MSAHCLVLTFPLASWVKELKSSSILSGLVPPPSNPVVESVRFVINQLAEPTLQQRRTHTHTHAQTYAHTQRLYHFRKLKLKIRGTVSWNMPPSPTKNVHVHIYVLFFCFFFFKLTFLQIRRIRWVECNVCSAEGAKSRNKHYQTWKRQDNDQKQFCHCQWMIYDGINKAGKEQQRAGNKLCCVLQPGSGRQIEERNFPVMPPIFQAHDWHTCFHSVMPL